MRIRIYVCMYVGFFELFNINNKGNRTIAPVGFFLNHLFPVFPSEADINYLIGSNSGYDLNHSLHKLHSNSTVTGSDLVFR